MVIVLLLALPTRAHRKENPVRRSDDSFWIYVSTNFDISVIRISTKARDVGAILIITHENPLQKQLIGHEA